MALILYWNEPWSVPEGQKPMYTSYMYIAKNTLYMTYLIILSFNLDLLDVIVRSPIRGHSAGSFKASIRTK